ncbi:MAG: hypothetical protein ACXV0U_02625 [Kineosporiaceae bacterium]
MSEPVPSSTDAQDTSARAPAPWPEWSSDLHESLASQEASAAELRQDLDDLRRTLDAAPTRPPAPASRSSFRSRRFVAGVAGLVFALALGAGLAARSARQGSPAASGARASTATPAPSGPTPTPPVTAATARPTPEAAGLALPDWPGRTSPQPPGLPARGVGADAGGPALTAALMADRSVDVYERALLTRGAATVFLRPAGLLDLARSLGAPPPVVEDLHAEVDGRPVPVQRTAAGWTVATPGGSPAGRLALRYRLSGALARQEPAPRGRYTLVLAPLAPSAGGGAGDAVVVRVTDPRIEELYCPGASNQLCGRENGALHTATVPAGAVPVVVALVTFPS